MKKEHIIILKKILEGNTFDYNYHYNYINSIINLDTKALDILKDNINNKNLFYALKLALCDSLKTNKNYYNLIKQVLDYNNSINVYEAVAVLTSDNLKDDPNKFIYFEKALHKEITKEEIAKKGRVSYFKSYLTSEKTVNDPNKMLIANKIIDSKELFHSEAIEQVSLNEKLKESSKRMEFINKLEQTTSSYQAKYASLFINYNNNYDDPNFLNVLSKILTSKEIYQARTLYEASSIKSIKSSKSYLKVMDLISKTISEEQALALVDIARIPYFVDQNNYIEELNSLLSCKESKELRNRVNCILKYIKKYENNTFSEINIDNVSSLMKYCYETSNYNYGIKLLEDLEIDNFDKNTSLHLKIRKKI